MRWLIVLAALPCLGQVRADETPAAWVSPEALATDLRSPDEPTRTRAQHLLGSTFDVNRGVAPKQVLLRYAPLGLDGTVQAIVAVEYPASDLVAAVAVKAGTGWRRIAAFGCWCKYDTAFPLDEFMRLAETGQGGYELVVHTSGGGTGLYTQHEVRYRVVGGRLKNVLAFVSERRSCVAGQPLPRPCTTEKRWV